MEIYLKQLFKSLLMKANLPDKNCFMLNSAAQRYFCQSLSKLENDCAVFYTLLVTTCARAHSPSFLSTHTQHTYSAQTVSRKAEWHSQYLAKITIPFTRAPQLPCSCWGQQEQPGNSSQVANTTFLQFPAPLETWLAGWGYFSLSSVLADASWKCRNK